MGGTGCPQFTMVFFLLLLNFHRLKLVPINTYEASTIISIVGVWNHIVIFQVTSSTICNKRCQPSISSHYSYVVHPVEVVGVVKIPLYSICAKNRVLSLVRILFIVASLVFRGVSKPIVMACPEILKQLGKKGTLTLGLFMPNCTRAARNG